MKNSSMQYMPPKRPELTQRREFIWYKPSGATRTLYEDMTVHEQSSSDHYAFQGWPIRFDDGRDPVTPDSTAIRSSDWFDFRDPNQTMYRSYISSTNKSEESLVRNTLSAREAGHFEYINAEWIKTGLSERFMVYPYINYGVFLAFCYAQREALSDTTTFPIVFSATDHLRHMQDAVFYSFELKEAFPDFSDADATEAWQRDPLWQGARAAIEQIIASTDWMEIVCAVNLCLEPLFGRLVKEEYFVRFAIAHGDGVTPLILASATGDINRDQAWTVALMRHICSDEKFGTKNREVLDKWVKEWTERIDKALNDFAPAFDDGTVKPTSFDAAASCVHTGQRNLLVKCGLG